MATKIATEDIAWVGGTAQAGEEVDDSSMESGVRERWIEAGVLVDPGDYVAPEPDEEPTLEPEPEGDTE